MATYSAPHQPPIITAADLARRWDKHESTITEWVRRGVISPVLRAGRSTAFSLADVLRIEAGQVNEDDAIVIMPLTSEGRTSPSMLRQRVDMAAQVVDSLNFCQRRLGGVPVKQSALDAVRLAVAAIRCQASGGNAAHMPDPLFGPRETRGIAYTEPNAPPVLCSMAYAALVHCLMSWESRETLHDLGDNSKRLMFESLTRLNAAIDEVATTDDKFPPSENTF